MITVKAFLELIAIHGVSNLDEGVIKTCYSYCVKWTAKEIHSKMLKQEKDWEAALHKADCTVQSAMTLLFENAVKQKIKPSDAKLTTYLTGICKNLLRNDKLPYVSLSGVEELREETESEEEKTALLNHLQKCMEKLGDKRKDLVLGFIDGKSHRQLAVDLDYKNEGVAKSTYHSVIQQLKSCMKGFFIS